MGVAVVGVAVVTSVVGVATVSIAFFSSFPQAATINADRSVTEPNKIWFFIIIDLLHLVQIFDYCPGVFASKLHVCSITGLKALSISSEPSTSMAYIISPFWKNQQK